MAQTAKTVASASALPPPPQLDPRVPPRFVKHKPTGRVTQWSPLFRRNVANFEVFYREGTQDALEHAMRIRRFEAEEARRRGFAYDHDMPISQGQGFVDAEFAGGGD